MADLLGRFFDDLPFSSLSIIGYCDRNGLIFDDFPVRHDRVGLTFQDPDGSNKSWLFHPRSNYE